MDLGQNCRDCREQGASLVVDFDCGHGIVCRIWDVLHFLPFVHRCRRLGKQHSGRLGLGHHEFRILDRYRPRRDVDFGDSASVPAEVAYIDKPRLGSDDPLRCDLRRDISRDSRRTGLDELVSSTDSEPELDLA